MSLILVQEADEVMIDNVGDGVKVIAEGEVPIEDAGVEVTTELTEHPLSRVFRNPVLMDIVCKVSDMDTIKKMRFVNEFWSTIATKELLKRSIFVLEVQKRSIKELERFYEETKQLKGIRRLCIPYESVLDGSKLLVGKSNFVLSEVYNFVNIVLHLAPSLEFLELYSAKHNNTLPMFIASLFPTNTRFPKLTKLVVSSFRYLLSNKIHLEYFYANAPNLEEIVLNSLGNPNADQFVFSLLQNKEDLSRNLNMLPSLNSLSLKSPLTPESIQGLIDLPQKWKKLEMVWASTWSKESVEVAGHLGKLLTLNKDSLVSLKLKELQDTGRWRIPVINFPATFSKLENLELSFVAQHCEDDDPDFEVDPNLEFKSHINFGGAVKYCKLFPKLKTFRLNIKNFTNSVALEDLCKNVFPKQVCESLQLLELDIGAFCLDYLKDEMKDENWMAIMFPNSVFKIL